MVGSRDMVKVQSEVKVRKWFEKGKSICFRGKKDRHESFWSLYIIHANSLYQCFINQQQQQQTLNNENKNSSTKKRKSCCGILFNHTLRHTFRVKFTSKTVSGIKLAELYDACWVVLDSTIYFFGVGRGYQIFYLKKEDLVASPSSVSFESAGFMTQGIKAPKVVALDGQIYVFGKSFCEVFKPNLHCPRDRSTSISSPLQFSNCDVQFAVAIEREKKIVVGFSYQFVDKNLVELLYPDVEATSGTAVFVYDVVGDSWVKLISNFLLNRKSLLCEPIAAGSCLYWFDTKLWAYDLNTKQYYEGLIEDCLFMQVTGTKNIISSHKVSLLHLVGDFFYMTWADRRDPYVHCTMIQAVKTTTKLKADNRFKLRATVLSCQTFASDEYTFLKDGALIF